MIMTAPAADAHRKSYTPVCGVDTDDSMGMYSDRPIQFGHFCNFVIL